MKRCTLLVCTVLLTAASCLTAAAQAPTAENPWNGSWKVIPSSFHYEGVTYTFATSPTGFSVSLGGQQVGKVVCDGKPDKSPRGGEATCIKTSTGYSITSTSEGKTTSVITLAVSDGGKKLTRTAHYTPADEAPYTMSLTYSRVSGKGVAGEWKENGFSESQDTGVLGIHVTGDSVAFQETDSPKAITCKLDGTPTTIGPDRTMAVKLIDPHTLKVAYANAGKVVRENTFALSLDGKMISETDFTADPTPSSMTLLFHKM